jgi:Ricin-type beta-trefoil lectin domain
MIFSAKFLPSLFFALTSLALPLSINQTPSQAQESNGRFINNLLSGKCIDVAGAPGRSNGAPLQLWDCELTGVNPDNNSITDQRWVLTSGGFIRNTLSGKCIDVAGAPGSSNGAALQLWDCELSGRNRDNGSTTDQRWTITGNGFIRNTLSGKCIDVAGAPGQTNGARLQLWDCELSGRNRDNGSDTDQKWSFAN